MNRFIPIVLAASVLAVGFTVTTAPAAEACPFVVWSVGVDSPVIGVFATNCLTPGVYPGGRTQESGVGAHAWHAGQGHVLLVVVDPAADEPVHAESVLLP